VIEVAWSEKAAEVTSTVAVFQLPNLSVSLKMIQWLKSNFSLGTSWLNFSLAIDLWVPVTLV